MAENLQKHTARAAAITPKRRRIAGSRLGQIGASRLQRIVCRKQNRFFLLDPAEIIWFYIDGGIVRAQTASENYWANYQLNQLEAGLDPELFFRARREVLVNLSKIKSVKPYDGSTFALVMTDSQETELLVSERRAKDLRSRFPGL